MNAPVALDVPQRAKLTVEDFLTLDRAGAFAAYGKTELLDGAVVFVNAQYAPHYMLKNRLYRRLADACDSLVPPLFAWSEGAISIHPHNLPEPDIFVTRAEPTTDLIDVQQVCLVVEVASTTLDTDLGAKARLYAGAGVPEYWVADVSGRILHQMWAPAGSNYAEQRQRPFGEPISAATISDLTIDTSTL